MAKKRDYSEIIHISPVNKKLFDVECKKKLITDNPELEGIELSANRVFTTMVKYYLGVSYFPLKSRYENELNSDK